MANYRNYSVQIGYLGSDPESRNAGDGKVITFDVATTKRWKDKETGEKKESVFWRRYEAWNKTGENILTRMKSGARIQVVSEPSNNKYEKEGVTHHVERHTVLDWLDLSGQPRDSQTGNAGAGGGDDFDDDIPF